MARRYSAIGADTVADETSLLGVTTATTVRPRIYELIFGSPATPADQAMEFYLQRFTAAGTATAVTPHGLDPADPASLCTAGQAHTVEPTYTAGQVLLDFAINQQATFNWKVLAEYGLVLPSTAANGAGLVCKEISGGSAALRAQLFWEE